MLKSQTSSYHRRSPHFRVPTVSVAKHATETSLSLKQLLQSIYIGSFLLRQTPVTKVKYVTSDTIIVDWHWEQQQNSTNFGLLEIPHDELWTFTARPATSKAWWRHENVLEPKNMPIQRVLRQSCEWHVVTPANIKHLYCNFLQTSSSIEFHGSASVC